MTRNSIPNLLLAAATLMAPFALSAQKLPRHWTGTAIVTNNGDDTLTPVPVELDLTVKGTQATGTFINGDQRSPSSTGTLTGSHLVLKFNNFARTLEGDIRNNEFKGTFGGARIKKAYTLELHPDGKPSASYVAAAKTATGKGAAINGDWQINLAKKSEKGEDAWTLHVSPFRGDGEIKAIIQRIDGDSNALFGRYDEAAGEYRVTRFADSGATTYILKPQPDGTLLVANRRDASESNIARRPDVAKKENLPSPTAPTDQTTMPNPNEPLRWSGPNLTGTTISSTDPDFKGKVVIVAIGGSWCPNCHDEAPLLVELYNRYHKQGLEIVQLSFEEGDQLKNPDRLRTFVTKYNIPYTVLLMGTPDDLNDKLPQPKNLNSWPTSFFIGRDGLVKKIHAGFSGPATGQAYVELKAETIAEVEKLLAQK